jgi:hypothetical protein
MSMLETLFFGLFAIFVIGALARRIFLLREHHYRHFGPNLYYRILDLLEPFAARRLSNEHLEQLELQAQALFEDILTGVGLVPAEWRVKLVLDDVRGPIPTVIKTDGETLTLAEFEGRLRNGKIDLPRR